MLFEKNAMLSMADVMSLLNVSRTSANSAVNALLKEGLVAKVGGGRTTRYRSLMRTAFAVVLADVVARKRIGDAAQDVAQEFFGSLRARGRETQRGGREENESSTCDHGVSL